MSGRFAKGRSGNPAGRPKKRRPNVSAFDIIFDKSLSVTKAGVATELSVEEVLQHQTYQEALKGGRMAIRSVLRMVEKREAALAKIAPPAPARRIEMVSERDPRNADEAMRILGIAEPDPGGISDGNANQLKLATWAAQAGLSRPGKKLLDQQEIDTVKEATLDPQQLRWPRGKRR